MQSRTRSWTCADRWRQARLSDEHGGSNGSGAVELGEVLRDACLLEQLADVCHLSPPLFVRAPGRSGSFVILGAPRAIQSSSISSSQRRLCKVSSRSL